VEGRGGMHGGMRGGMAEWSTSPLVRRSYTMSQLRQLVGAPLTGNS
jgi:hypothetical protein